MPAGGRRTARSSRTPGREERYAAVRAGGRGGRSGSRSRAPRWTGRARPTRSTRCEQLRARAPGRRARLRARRRPGARACRTGASRSGSCAWRRLAVAERTGAGEDEVRAPLARLGGSRARDASSTMPRDRRVVVGGPRAGRRRAARTGSWFPSAVADRIEEARALPREAPREGRASHAASSEALARRIAGVALDKKAQRRDRARHARRRRLHGLPRDRDGQHRAPDAGDRGRDLPRAEGRRRRRRRGCPSGSRASRRRAGS